MTITTAQIRGARGILSWSQQDLSDRTDISTTSIGSIEKGTTKPRTSTLKTIQAAFENAGIEFTAFEGIRLKDSYITTLFGSDGFSKFLDDVYFTAIANGTKDKQTKIYLSNVAHDNWVKWMGAEKWKMHTDRMIKDKNIMDVRILIKDGDTSLPAESYAKYRGLPKELFNEQSFYAYHNKLAFINFSKDDVKITIMEQAEFADGYRNLFEIAWNSVGKPIEYKKTAGGVQ